VRPESVRSTRGTGSSYSEVVRLTDFWDRMHRQFGETYAESFARDVVIRELGGRTVEQALAEGESAKDVWRAVCQVVEVPARER
jgi:Protein of unknown function (DUF3046)